jgi:ribosomal-protein-alanine N-acetyltransferase
MAAALKVFLRPMVESDFTEAYISWFRDPLVTRFLSARNISIKDSLDHWQRGLRDNVWHMFAICAAEDGRHIGNLKLGPIHWGHMVSDMSTVIGDRSTWGQGRAREAIWLGIRVAFDELKIRKLSASIDAHNVGSIKAYVGAGYHIEATLKDQFMDVAQSPPRLSDRIYVACFNPSFRTEDRRV